MLFRSGSRQHDLDAVLPMISDSSLTVVSESVVNSQSSLGVSNESHMESKMERCEKDTRARGEGVSPSCPPLFCCAHISFYAVQ